MCARPGAWGLAVLAVTLLATACREDGARPTTVVAVTDTADQMLQAFHHFVTADGVRQSEVQADTAFFFDGTQKTLLRRMRVAFFDSAGAKQATVVADRGEYLWQTGSMTAEGSVVMTTTDGRILKSEKLVFDEAKQQICTDLPFDFEDRSSHVQGQGFCSDKNFTNIRASKPTGTSKDGVLLPGQDDEPADTGKKP
jgi:LPS export ABC transporter protein LptC